MVDYAQVTIKTVVTDMLTYFGRKAVPRIVDMYVDALQEYGNKTVRKSIFYFIHNAEKLPKIADIKWYIEKTYGISKPKVYDKDEDFEFPLYLLETGLRILEKKGEHEFFMFADRVGMPRGDRARVIDKHKLAYEAPIIGKEI